MQHTHDMKVLVCYRAPPSSRNNNEISGKALGAEFVVDSSKTCPKGQLACAHFVQEECAPPSFSPTASAAASSLEWTYFGSRPRKCRGPGDGSCFSGESLLHCCIGLGSVAADAPTSTIRKRRSVHQRCAMNVAHQVDQANSRWISKLPKRQQAF